MTANYQVAILNKSCVDILEHCRNWLSEHPIDLIIPSDLHSPSIGELTEPSLQADAIILPAPIVKFPDEDFYAKAKKLKVISIAASGHDWFDLQTASGYGIPVANSPILEGAAAVADLTLGFIILSVRKIQYQIEQVKKENYERMIGMSLHGKKLGIIGLGNIGREVAKRAAGFGMEILAFDINQDLRYCRENRITPVSFEHLISNSDIISLHIRLNEKTQGIIGNKELASMKNNVVLVNTARRELCDEIAVFDFLRTHKEAVYAQDEIPAVKKSDLHNFISTPHIGNRTYSGMEAVFRCAVENILDIVNKGSSDNILNPEVLRKERK